ncbi:hypothetical protein HWB76_gp084 [Streptomyces phage Blueeyedbeauty]|uniref:Uncharacterized protein n=1 Tax=Streptomyces phage Blueeyedbeauty TaxID=2250336 RepID=A0A345L214_9CAUD|nr:hypothetical protein HWB76_gp084 [Streptomyces phage Blueeyedbeauty]AXH49316.1 hypothetical protein SEA_BLUEEYEDBEAUTY_209 [Streptomyces phage Blueeyedbeauty]
MITVQTEVQALGHMVPVEICFTPEDPACITFTFFNQADDSTPEWLVGRELLKDVLEKGYSGLGDVRFLAIENDIKMGLSSPEGQGYVLFEREIIEEFVEMIYEEVPEGEDVYEIPDGVPEEWEDTFDES